MSEAGGGDLFIVDNSVSGWTGLEYLRQWSDLARSFDIATGFFEIGALLALDGKWQQLEKIRLLMGDEVSLQTHKRPPSQDVEPPGSVVGVRDLFDEGFRAATALRARGDAPEAHRPLAAGAVGRDRSGRRRSLAL